MLYFDVQYLYYLFSPSDTKPEVTPHNRYNKKYSTRNKILCKHENIFNMDEIMFFGFFFLFF